MKYEFGQRVRVLGIKNMPNQIGVVVESNPRTVTVVCEAPQRFDWFNYRTMRVAASDAPKYFEPLAVETEVALCDYCEVYPCRAADNFCSNVCEETNRVEGERAVRRLQASVEAAAARKAADRDYDEWRSDIH